MSENGMKYFNPRGLYNDDQILVTRTLRKWLKAWGLRDSLNELMTNQIGERIEYGDIPWSFVLDQEVVYNDDVLVVAGFGVRAFTWDGAHIDLINIDLTVKFFGFPEESATLGKVLDALRTRSSVDRATDF